MFYNYARFITLSILCLYVFFDGFSVYNYCLAVLQRCSTLYFVVTSLRKVTFIDVILVSINYMPYDQLIIVNLCCSKYICTLMNWSKGYIS